MACSTCTFRIEAHTLLLVFVLMLSSSNCDSLYEKGPYHAQIEFSVQGFELKKKIFSNFFFFFFWIFMDLGPRASHLTFKPNMTRNEPFLASVTRV